MMNQETYVNINDLHKQGWKINETAAETDWHRTTISDLVEAARSRGVRGN